MIWMALLIALAMSGGQYRSIHQQQELENRHLSGDKGPAYEIVPLDASRSPRVNKVVFGYDPYWTSDTYLHYDLITHLACFSVGVNSDGSLDNSHNFPSLWSATINLAHKNGVKVVLCATCFNSTTIASVLSSAAYRTNAVKNLINMVRQANCDGVNIDFEGLPSSQKQNMVKFTRELSDSFHAWNPGSHVSLATPAVDWSGAWDYDSLAIYSDGLFIMAYDYFWSGSSTTGPVSPLDGYSRDVLWTIHDYVYYSGGRREKLICGFPYYGYDWPCTGSQPGAGTTGSGSSVIFKNAADSALKYGRQWYDPSYSPWYYYGSYRQCWYDDEVSLGYKYQAVWDSSLAGTGMWALSYDGSRHELWDALRWAFNKPNDSLGNGGMELVFLDTAAVPSADSLRPEGWLEGQYALAVTATDYVHSGSRALKHYPKGWGKSPPYTSTIFQDVYVQPQTAYRLKLWARKNDGAGNVMRARIAWLDGKHREIREDTTAALIADSAGYKFLTTGTVFSPANSIIARIKLNIWATSTTPYWDRWDEVSLEMMSGVDQGYHQALEIPDLKLYSVGPNPFSRFTDIGFEMPKPGWVSLKLYNTAGQLVRTLLAEHRVQGCYRVRWGGDDDAYRKLTSGMYFFRLRCQGQERTLRVLLLR